MITHLRFPILAIAIAANCGASWLPADEPAVSAEVDRLLAESWQRDGIDPTPISGDAEFHRRAWLDLAGIAPPVWDVRQFLSDPNPSKRIELVDRLLVSSHHADHMASLWIDFLLPAQSQNDIQQRENVLALRSWLRLQFLENTPYDHLVGGFLTAGGAGDSGPAIFYTSNSLNPEKLAAATSRAFLGIQIQCAQCHDHPFDRWTQEDFWGYAAFFSQLQSSESGTNRRVILEDRVGAEVRLPETDTIIEPRYPGATTKPEPDPADNRRRQLTIWLASRDNPYFARAAVNRAWSHLFGRGLVDPVDAMDAANKPSHPSVINLLTDEFIEHRFDLRWLYRTLATTDAYGRTSKVTSDQRPPDESFATMQVKTLSASQFYDSLSQNVFRHRTNDEMIRETFLSRMRSPGSSAKDYPHGVVQVLALLNGTEIALATDSLNSGLLVAIEAPFFDQSAVIETLFLAILSRQPTADESVRFAEFLDTGESPDDRQKAVGDVLWVLLNTAECAVCP